MTETPKEAARRLSAKAINEGFIPKALHSYREADGAPIYWRIRAEHPEGRKWIRPMRLNGSRYELGEPDFPNGKPLYRLNQVTENKDAEVFVVEGEKAADALARCGLIVTTSGGAESADTADWGALRGRACKVWPDNDEAGQRYATAVSERLRALGCAVQVIDVAQLSLPPKGDAVEWLETHQNATLSDFEALPVVSPSPPASNALQSDLPRVELIDAASITPEAVLWHWDGWLAAGKVHILAGPPGTGKTTVALALAATLTIGARWPDRSPAPLKSVVVWSGEDSPGDVLIPRLIANGADLTRVKLIGRVLAGAEAGPFDPSRDVALLWAALASTPDLGLLIVDPIVSAVAGDMHKNNEVRRALQPLADFAAATGCAVVGISHFSKGTSGKDPTERVTGSIAFGAAARLVIGAAKRSEDEGGGRMIVRAKNNLGPDTGGFCYDIEQCALPGYPNVTGSRVMWGAPLEGTAKALLNSAETDASEEDRTELADCKRFLSTLLENGPVPSKQVKRDSDDAGYSWITTRRAHKALGVTVAKAGMRDGWTWELPKMLKKREDAQQFLVSTFGKDEHLRPSEPPLEDREPEPEIAGEPF